jgi:hypothetical protein
MKTFLNWAGENKKELPLFQPIGEDTKRGGIAHWAYPDAYVRSQYPDLYFVPHMADALFKMGKHQPSRKAPSNEAP